MTAGHERDENEQLREIFIGMLGHDLRTPLSAILSAAGVLRRRARTDDEAKLPEIILRASRRMTSLIQDLLDMSESRLGGGVRVVPSAADLSNVIANAIAELEGASPSGRFDAQAFGDTTGHWDAERMAQVLTNLLTNAVTHGAAMEPVRIRVDGRDSTEVVVEINNQGAPISERLLPVIFDPFRRGDVRDNSKSNGIGLGLYIAERIVAAHGGRVSVRSSSAEGTTFTIVVPRSMPGAPSTEGASS